MPLWVCLFVCFYILGKIEMSLISMIILFKHYSNSSCLSAVASSLCAYFLLVNLRGKRTVLKYFHVFIVACPEKEYLDMDF